MEFSRFVFGIGGESLAVAQNTYASVWFKGDILNMVFGLQTSIARVGSTVNFQVVGPLFRKMKEIPYFFNLYPRVQFYLVTFYAHFYLVKCGYNSRFGYYSRAGTN